MAIRQKIVKESCSGNVIYGLGIIGALIHYVSSATGFWSGFIGVFKALIWPAFLVYELLNYLVSIA